MVVKGKERWMNARQAHAYREHQTLEATLLLRDLAQDSSLYRTAIERFAASIVLSISYGRRCSSIEDHVVAYQIRTIKEFMRATAPGKHIADSWPILLHLPLKLQWFRRKYDTMFADDLRFYKSLVDDVRERMTAGTQKECMTSRALTDNDDSISDAELAYFVSAPFSAGLHTTAAGIEYAIMAALTFPEPARKAQQELDEVVGKDRLPSFTDENSLPYVCAWIKELERWRPVVPLGVPHAVSRDDEFDGSIISKGATVYANLYTMLQDPDMFPEPDVFRPERFLANDGESLDPRLRDFTLPFGFGRRLCPGMHVAGQSLFIVISRLLWAFDVQQPPNTPLPDTHAYISNGLTRSPSPFKFVLRPRTLEARGILEIEAAEADVRVKEWE